MCACKDQCSKPDAPSSTVCQWIAQIDLDYQRMHSGVSQATGRQWNWGSQHNRWLPKFYCLLVTLQCPCMHSSCASTTNNIYNTVNRGDFGQIFTIFINIFIMMNSILGFIWGLVSTMLEHHILYTLNSSWLLHSEIFSVEPCPKSPRSSGWLWTHQHIYGFPK